MDEWNTAWLSGGQGQNFYSPANLWNGQPAFPPPQRAQQRPFPPGGIADRIRQRKLLKRGLANAQSIQVNAYTGQPTLLCGMREVFRQKERNPIGSHFAVLFTDYNGTWAYDLQFKDGPRVGISFQKLAAGKVVYVSRFIPPGPEMDKALERLRYAIANFKNWNLLSNNCEHWAKFVMRGDRKSAQADGIGLLGVLGICAALAP